MIDELSFVDRFISVNTTQAFVKFINSAQEEADKDIFIEEVGYGVLLNKEIRDNLRKTKSL